MLGHEPVRTAQDSPGRGREGASRQHLGPAGDSLKLHEVSSGLRKPRTQVGGPRTWFHQTAMALYSPASLSCGASLSLPIRPVAALRGLSVNGGDRQEVEPHVGGGGCGL